MPFRQDILPVGKNFQNIVQNVKGGYTVNVDGFVKSPFAVLHCILSHCGAAPSTPHSSGEFILSLSKDAPCNWNCLQTRQKRTFYECINVDKLVTPAAMAAFVEQVISGNCSRYQQLFAKPEEKVVIVATVPMVEEKVVAAVSEDEG